MRKYGLIGYPLGHSFSRTYFYEKFLNENISGCLYENFPIPGLEGLTDLLTGEPDLCGLNVTIPYKSEILKYLDSVDPEAKEIGAVNVVKIRRSKDKIFLTGFNSDITGISDSISPFAGEVKSALVLGTGGSSRAVCHILKKLGLNFEIVSRNKRPGILSYSDVNSDLLRDTRLIINTTPLGMYPNTDGKPEIDYSLLNSSHILFDLVYNPEITSFLRRGQQQGCTVITGLKMLHSQAERSWQIWNDERL